jgi:hypothetical protein
MTKFQISKGRIEYERGEKEEEKEIHLQKNDGRGEKVDIQVIRREDGIEEDSEDIGKKSLFNSVSVEKKK